MRRRLGFFTYLAQRRFADALAQLEPQTWPKSGWDLWAAYRLGLYATVASARWDGRHQMGGMAKAVSLAACGHAEDAAAVVRRLKARHGDGAYLHTLADDLAPFAPALALDLLKPLHAPRVLHLALLLRNGQMDQARAALKTAFAHGAAAHQPELWLLATNAFGGEPAEQLQRLNAYLGSFVLPALALQDAALPPVPGNLRSAQPLSGLQGPLVSVIMTAFNAQDRIGYAIEGMLSQSWRQLEVVVVDDASTDGTAELVEGLAAKDARVRLCRLPCNVGTYVAKTVGLHLARGEFATCHDSDDWSHPQRIEQQVRPLLANPRLIATTSQWVRMEDNGNFYARPVHPLARLNPASPLFRRREVVEQAGLWDAVRTGADSEFLSRLRLVFGRQAIKRLVLPLTLGSHRPGSLMTATETGYGATGVSPIRLAYWEAWTHWHISSLHAKQKPVMPDVRHSRPYAVPEAIAVSQVHARRCLDDAVRQMGSGDD